MSTMLIAMNQTRESGSFMGDQLCSLKTAYLFVENQPDVTSIIMSMSPGNEMNFLWKKFIDTYKVDIIWDNWNPGDWSSRWETWDKWRTERCIEGLKFDHYRELYLRIHGAQRQTALCGLERGLGRKNIFEYWLAGQENNPDTFINADWFDDSLCYHPVLTPDRDVYISPHCKTQGNYTFTFEFWSDVIHILVDAGVSVTVGYDNYFCEDLNSNPLYKKHWGSHEEWFQQVCKHKLVACGNTGTGWVSAACGVPLITMEPPNSQMPDHRYRECGLRNIVEVVDEPNADYVAKRIIEETQRKVVMTTGCYDVLHAGHVRHLEKSKALGTKLIVALNSDESVKRLKGPTRPINTQNQRKSVLEALRCVDEVKIFDGDNAMVLLQEYKPNILTNGFGYELEDVVGKDFVESYGGKVVITCTGDASNEPSTTKIVQKVLRSGDIIEICRIGAQYSVNPFDKLKLMAEEFCSVANLEGDVADLGTYRGGSALILRRLRPDKNLHLFDTWTGTPLEDELCHHKVGEWATSLEDCKKLVGVDSKTHYYKGIFPYEANEADLGRFCFVYVDMDIFHSTREAILFFWPRLVKGGKMVFDDYRWPACRGVERAVDEAFTNNKEYDVRIIEFLYTCVVTKQ